MKITNIILLIFIPLLDCFPQANGTGETTLQGYIGTDWYKTLYATQFTDTTKENLVNEDGENVTVEKRFNVTNKSSSGAWGIRLEHFLTKRFTIGLDFWYAHTTVTANCIKLEYNNDPYYFNYYQKSPSPTITYGTISKDLSRLNTTLRFDLHVGRSPFFDPYFHVALGAAIYKYFITSSNTSVYDETPIYLPLSFKLGSGAKFWLNKNVAAMIEVSIGGPLIAGGVCYKIPQKIRLNLKEGQTY